MKVREILANALEVIQKNCPQLPVAYQGEAAQTKEKRAIISDIQQRLAEIYLVLTDLSADMDPELTWEQALKKYASITKPALNQILILCLSIATKFKIPIINACLESHEITVIETINRHCFALTNLQSPEWSVLKAGIIKTHEYTHYKTGLSKRFGPGMVPGQIMVSTISTAKTLAPFTAALIRCRQVLDPQFKPSPEQMQMIAGDPKLAKQFEAAVTKELDADVKKTPALIYPTHNTSDPGQALRRCTVNADPKALQELLTDKAVLAVLNSTDTGENGFTALHLACCKKNKTPQALILLQAGAKSDIEDKHHKTATDYCIENDNKDVLGFLLGQILVTPLLQLIDINHAFLTAATQGNSNHIKVLLAANKVLNQSQELEATTKPDRLATDEMERINQHLRQRVNIRTTEKRSGMTALHKAVIGKHVLCAKLLLDAGADPDLPDDNYKSARDYAEGNAALLLLMPERIAITPL
ncbi:MAG: hypothetical protein M3R00_06170 [Pseudomonadota bacterium]|nr:hypothetical protein [Pseudomonadota bacterium]